MDVATLSNKLTETTGYVVRPNFEEKFRSTKIQEILYSCISDVLGDKKFEQDSCPEWTKTSMLINENILTTTFIEEMRKEFFFLHINSYQ
jgi:hypothetical protein